MRRAPDAVSINLNTTLRNLPLAPPVVVDPATPVRDALGAIDARGAEAAVIVDMARSVPLGIVTLRDALRSIVDDDSDLDGPVSGEFPETANRLNPDRLHKLDRQILKEAFRQARTLQQRLRLDYLA